MPKSQQPIEGENIILRRLIETGSPSLILDVGAGDGKWGRLLSGKWRLVCGIEAWKDCIEKNVLDDVYWKVINEDMRNLPVIFYKLFDAIILGDVLEHVERNDALLVIDRLKLSGVKTFLTVPISECKQDGSVYGNPFETHLDQWSHNELAELGWKLLHKGTNEAGTVTIGTYVLNESV